MIMHVEKRGSGDSVLFFGGDEEWAGWGRGFGREWARGGLIGVVCCVENSNLNALN
jgi:hypothetical protein